MRRKVVVVAAVVGVLSAGAAPALACGGLIGPNGAVNLLRTTTFAGYHDGVEHYVTAFQFAGGGGAFGSLTPLPGVPTKVERGGDWTLQRLIRETQPPPTRFAGADLAAQESSGGVRVLLETRIDALDITVLSGGGADVGRWARDRGFRLPPDAPEVLDFYASRSPVFLAASFDADEARRRGQNLGDGTPIHVTIPTPNPWVPLRILALGKQASEIVEADVYLLTDVRPALLSTAPIGRGSQTLSVVHDAPASASLLADLNSDKGMSWVPTDRAWLTQVRVSGPAGDITGDLAVDASGQGVPSRRAAGFVADLDGVRSALERRESVPVGVLVVLSVVAGMAIAGAAGARGRARG